MPLPIHCTITPPPQVKRFYMKANLVVHPNKVSQAGRQAGRGGPVWGGRGTARAHACHPPGVCTPGTRAPTHPPTHPPTHALSPPQVKQKGGTLEQVATADMVFDVLKAAWNKFEAAGR